MSRIVSDREILSWMNTVKKNEKWFVSPKYNVPKGTDTVSIGILSHFGYYYSSIALGISSIYHSINRDVECHGIADRVFIYDPIANKDGFTTDDVLLENPLFTLERNIPLNKLDLICVSLTDTDAITTVFHLLKLGGIPIKRSDRKLKTYPLIIAGGPGCGNPEAFADFFDIITIGDGSIQTPKVVNAIYELKSKGVIFSAGDIFKSLSNFDGIYVPELYQFEFENEKIKNLSCVEEGRMVYPAIDPPSVYTYGSLFSSADTAVILPNRGCKNRCSYCQLGLQQYREMPLEPLLDLIDTYLENGITNIILNSASITQYSKVGQLLDELAKKIELSGLTVKTYIGSLCFNELTRDVLAAMNRLGAFSHTYILYTDAELRKFMALAPEHGSSSLLQSLGRILKPWEILDAIDMASEVGVYNFNLYFMVGFPSETIKDRRETANLISAIADKIYSHKGKVIVKINPLIPTPGTACQRMKMATVPDYKKYISEIQHTIESQIGKERFDQQIEIVPLPDERLVIESLIDRTDRRIGCFIEKLFEYRISGKEITTDILNSWLMEIGFSWDMLSGERSEDEILPWSSIDFGTKKQERIILESIRKRMKN